jgi:hypothetical protein
MIKNQKLRDWLAEQPLILAFTRPSALVSMDRERALALIISPVLAGALVIGGGIGAGYAAGGNNSPTVQNTIETSIAEPVVEEREVEEVIVDIDPVEQAIATWGEPDIAAILSEAFPEAEWSLNGNSYSGLTWFGPGAKPTEAELRRLWVTLGGVFLERQQLAEAEAEAEAAERKAAEEVRAADPTRQELCQAIDYKALYGPGIDYTKILSVHYPGAQWSLNGSAYSGLTWISPGTKPTQATLDGLWDGVAFGLCLQKPLTELQARAGTSETEEFVDGAVRPKGYSEGTFVPTLETCSQLPQLPADTFTGGSAEVPQGEVFVPPAGYGAIKSGSGWASGRGDYDVYTYGIELPNGLSATGLDLTQLGCRIAEAHGYWGNQFTIGLSLSGDTILHVLNSQVDRGTLDQVLRSVGAL